MSQSQWGNLLEDLQNRGFQATGAPIQDADGTVRYEVSDESGTLVLTADEILELVVHNNPHEKFRGMLEHTQ